MASDVLLRMVSALTVEDVRDLDSVGLGDEVEELLKLWMRMSGVLRWVDEVDRKVWDDFWWKLLELRAALKESEWPIYCPECKFKLREPLTVKFCSFCGKEVKP